MKKTLTILFVVVLLVSSTLTACGGNASGGKLIVYDNYPTHKLLAISPILPTGKISELPWDNTNSRYWQAVSPDGETLAFVKALGGPEVAPGSYDSESSVFRLEIYQAQNLSSPITLEIPDNIAYSMGEGIVYISPIWLGEDIFLLVARDGPPEEYHVSKYIGLVKVNVSEQSFELVKIDPLANKAFYNNCFECVLPDLSKVSMVEGNLQYFTIFDTGNQTLTDFTMIGMPDTYATWTPDGKGLVYMTQMGNQQLCLIKVSIDGKNIQSKEVFCPEFQTQSERMYHHTTELHWSPDGKYLAININANFGLPTSSTEPYETYLYVLRMDSDRPEVSKIYSSPSGGVTWSPDSRKLAFVATTPRERSEIYTVNRDGTDLTMVYTNPEWDPAMTNPNIAGFPGIAGWLK